MTKKEMHEIYNRASILGHDLAVDLKPKQWEKVLELIELELLLEAESNK